MRPVSCPWKEPTINAHTRPQQSDLVVGLLNLIGRNRLALVVLAASLTAGARSRAREAYSESAAVRWLSRNARAVRHFLQSLSLLRRCAGQAGYRALERAGSAPRRLTAPRRMLPSGVTVAQHRDERAAGRTKRLIAGPAGL